MIENIEYENDENISMEANDSGTEDDPEMLYNLEKYKTYTSAKRFFNSYAAKTKANKLKRNSIADEATPKDSFTLQFYTEADNEADTEKVLVSQGKSIKETIESYLLSRELNFNTHSVFLESSKTPLPLAFDTYPLRGNTLHVKANQEMQIDQRIISLMKGAIEEKNQRQKKSESMENLLANKHNSVPSNGKLRKNGLLNSLKDMSRNISEMLAKHSLDDSENGDPDNSQFDKEVRLEDSWTDVIDCDDDNVSKGHRIQQEAIWELLTTERNYIRKIRVIIKVFKRYLLSLQDDGYLTEVDPGKLFSNISEVYETNLLFWRQHLNPVVEQTRQTKQPIQPTQLLNAFEKFEEHFEPYDRYCLEESGCVKYLKILKRSNEKFEEYLLWCEENKQCMRLKLADLLVKPMQRVTKYALLLKAILHKTQSPHECEALQIMISGVEQFVGRINTSLRLRHEQQKLEAITAKIEMYSPVELLTDEMEKLVSEFSSLDLRARIPGLSEQRCILFQGPMRIVEKQGRNDVFGFLFTDVLLIGKQKKGSDKFRIIRQPYRVNKILLKPLKDPGAILFIYLNEYGVLATAFTFLVNLNDQSKWLDAVGKARSRYEKAHRGSGSTLDFLDDEIDTSLSHSNSISPRSSPAMYRRSETTRPDTNSLKEHKAVLRRSFITKDSETESVNGTPEPTVKRSLSDPKSRTVLWSYDRGVKQKNRPTSTISISEPTSGNVWFDKDSSNGKLSRRSSGIGDSFRSVCSDGCVSAIYSPSTPTSEQNTPVNISKLKSQFETNKSQQDSLNDIAELSTNEIDGAQYLDSSVESIKTLNNKASSIELNGDDTLSDKWNTSKNASELDTTSLSRAWVSTADASSQYCMEPVEVSTQCELQSLDASTQCGDFIHLNSSSEKNETLNKSPLYKRRYEHHVTYSPPLRGAQRGILKHAHSETNIHQLHRSHSPIVHVRSRSEEPSTKPTTYNNNGPGMRALLTLSESLEYSLQRSYSTGSELKSPRSDDTSLDDVEIRSVKSTQESQVRNTWHSFDSSEALEQIEKVKYGKMYERPVSQSISDITSTSSTSSKKSFKKLDFFKKRFSLYKDSSSGEPKPSKKKEKKEKRNKKVHSRSQSMTPISNA